MKKQSNKKTIAVVVLIIALLGLSVAFAALSTTLTINGRAVVDPDQWKVKFENLSAGTKTGLANITTEATLEGETSIKGYDVILKAPGDSVSYTFDVTNSGEINAKLTSIVKPEPTCTGKATDDAQKTADATLVSNHLTYTLVYTDTKVAVAENDTLDAGVTKNLTLTIAYDADAAEVPSAEVEISGLNIDLVYGQN